MRNSNGPNTETSETPVLTGLHLESALFSKTYSKQFDRYDVIRFRIDPLIPQFSNYNKNLS